MPGGYYYQKYFRKEYDGRNDTASLFFVRLQEIMVSVNRQMVLVVVYTRQNLSRHPCTKYQETRLPRKLLKTWCMTIQCTNRGAGNVSIKESVLPKRRQEIEY